MARGLRMALLGITNRQGAEGRHMAGQVVLVTTNIGAGGASAENFTLARALGYSTLSPTDFSIFHSIPSLV